MLFTLGTMRTIAFRFNFEYHIDLAGNFAMNLTLRSMCGFMRASLIVAALVGCASSEKDHAIARTQNSRAAYEGFVRRHPESIEARLAKVQLPEIYA